MSIYVSQFHKNITILPKRHTCFVCSGDESTANRPQKKKKLTKKATKSGISLDEEEDELSAKQKLAEEEARKKEFEKEKVEKEEAAMTKKTDDLWAGPVTTSNPFC